MSKERFIQKWTVASFFGDIQVGFEFPREETPLHATLAGVFAINQTGDNIAEILNKSLNEEKALIIKGKAIENWGGDLNVTLIKESEQFSKLCRKVQKILLDNAAVFNEPQYLGDGFKPHVTVQKDERLLSESTAKVDSISLVDMFPNGDGFRRRIHSIIRLKND